MDSLSSITIGSPDDGFERLLQFGTQTLSSGGVLGLGDGTESLLWLDNAGIGVLNGSGFKSKIRTAATVDRLATLADGDGTLFPAIEATLASDSTESAGTPTAVGAFSVSLEASAVYEFELLLIVESAGASTSPNWIVTGPTSETSFVYYECAGQYVTAACFTAWGTTGTNAANPPAANAPYLVRVRGVVKTTGTTPATAVGISLFTETASTAVTLKAGSKMLFRKIN